MEDELTRLAKHLIKATEYSYNQYFWVFPSIGEDLTDKDMIVYTSDHIYESIPAYDTENKTKWLNIMQIAIDNKWVKEDETNKYIITDAGYQIALEFRWLNYLLEI